MPSPFPGMDPWLEGGVFPNFHAALTYLMSEALNAALPPGYAAMGSTLVWTEPEQKREPDVSVAGPRARPTQPGGVAVAELPGLRRAGAARRPAVVTRNQKYLEIRSTPDMRLVTAVEVLSPANKAPGAAGRAAYQQKQIEFRRAGVHLVEIDLLRAGAHSTAIPRTRLEALGGPFDYHVCVTVAGRPGQFHAATWRLADSLPAFGVPLDPGVPAPVVALRPLLDRAYDTGRYATLLDYARPCDPPLTPEQAVWAASIPTPARSA